MWSILGLCLLDTTLREIHKTSWITKNVLFAEILEAVCLNSKSWILFLINDSHLGLKGQTVTDYCVIHTLTCQPLFPLDILKVRTKKIFLINSCFNMTNKFSFLSSLCCKREKGQERHILKICYTMGFFFIVNSLYKLVINNLQK